ncbi:hypothetical protein [Actinoallomurus sp. CA-150999]|uniref:hypothetical protein n=1 Tax=Actinoallomurus sp. CA-150999 TaxID=3239887 RepID=UPI003D92E6CF
MIAVGGRGDGPDHPRRKTEAGSALSQVGGVHTFRASISGERVEVAVVEARIGTTSS